MASIIHASGSGNPGVVTTADSDGALTIRVGPLAAPVNAIVISAAGALTLSAPLPVAQGGTGSSSAVVPTTITVANEASDTTCFPLFSTAATGDLGPKSNTGLTYNSATNALATGAIAVTGTLSSTTGANFATSSGSVGVGNASPAVKLMVVDTGAAWGNNSGIFDIRVGIEINDARVSFGYSPTGNYGWIRSVRPNVANDHLILNPDSGNIGIGMTNPAVQFELSGATGQKSSGTAWSNPSDVRLKTVHGLADLQRCYDDIKAIPLKRYTLKNECFSPEQATDRTLTGWVANDVLPIIPKAVGVQEFAMVKVADGTEEVEKDGVMVTQTKYRQDVIKDCLRLDTSQLFAALYGTVQLLQQRNEELNAKFDAYVLAHP